MIYAAIVAVIIAIGYAIFQTWEKMQYEKRKALDNQNLTLGNSATPTIVYTTLTSPSITEFIRSKIDLDGIAPSGAKMGVNTVNKKTFYVDDLGYWQEIVVGNSTARVPITILYTPPSITNNLQSIENVAVAGLLVTGHYDFNIDNNLSAYPSHSIEFQVSTDGLLTISVSNTGGTILNLPELSISILQLN